MWREEKTGGSSHPSKILRRPVFIIALNLHPLLLQIKATLWEGGVRGLGLIWSSLLGTPRRVSEQVTDGVLSPAS
jgi:hypothetical protein